MDSILYGMTGGTFYLPHYLRRNLNSVKNIPTTLMVLGPAPGNTVSESWKRGDLCFPSEMHHYADTSRPAS